MPPAAFGTLAVILLASAVSAVVQSKDNLYVMPAPGPTDGPARQNCSYSQGGLQPSWVEITDVQDYLQYASTSAGYTDSDLPDPLPMPYSSDTGERWSAPAFEGICFARSPSAPENCTEGEDCLVYMDNFNETWLEIADLLCIGSYPVQGLTSSAVAGAPPAGNVSVTLTNQCKMYNYNISANSSWMAVMTDEWGNQYALQTASFPMESQDDWDTNLAGVVPPPGWKIDIVDLKEQEDHLPYMMEDGEICAFPILRDNQGNAWHQFVYNTPVQEGLFSAVQCEAMNVQYTISSGGGV